MGMISALILGHPLIDLAKEEIIKLKNKMGIPFYARKPG
jgi:adenylyl- and sulfurtransferase ThiI